MLLATSYDAIEPIIMSVKHTLDDVAVGTHRLPHTRMTSDSIYEGSRCVGARAWQTLLVTSWDGILLNEVAKCVG
jgi:hypothetical protein